YVMYGQQPETSSYDCRPYRFGNEETCTFNLPKTGVYYIMVHAYSAISNVTLRMSYESPLPIVTTNPAANVTSSSATLGGNVTSEGDDVGGVTDRGIVYSATNTQPSLNGIGSTKLSIGGGMGMFSSGVAALSPGTTYYVKAYATNASGTNYGSVVSFTTPSSAATVTSIVRADPNINNQASADYIITFSSPVSGLNITNFSITTTGLSGVGFPGISGSGTTWTATVTTGSGSGTLRLNLANTTGISPTVSNLPFKGETYTIDRTAPTVALSSSTAASGSSSAAGTFSYTAQFSESVGASFIPASILVSNGTVTGFTANSSPAYSYTFTVTPSAAGNVDVSIPAAAAEDVAGNKNLASAVYSIDYTPSNPEIAVSGTSTPMTTVYGSASAPVNSYTVTGTDLTSGITVTAPSGFEVSSNGTTYGSTATLPATGGNLSVRLSATSIVSSYSGSLQFASGLTTNNATQLTGTVSRKTLTITANDLPKTYGTAITAGGTYSVAGLANGETVGSVSIAYGTGSAATAATGTYDDQVIPGLASGGTFTSSNYSIIYFPGDIVVNAKALTVTANVTNKTYGQTLIGGSGSVAFTVSGLENGETIGGVSVSYGTGALVTAPVNTYTGQVIPSAATGGTFAASNYNITYATGNIVVGAKALTITANNQNKAYGALLSGAAGSTAFSSTGLENGEIIGSVSIAFGTGSAANAAVGTYDDQVTLTAATGGNFTASNYNITYAAGDIIVGAKALTITANTANKTYGQLLTAVSGSTDFTASGLENGETVGSVNIAYGTGSATNAAVGTYDDQVTASAATGGTFTAANYNITYTPGDIIVGTKTLVITANNQNKTYGEVLTSASASTA
ncbi:MAG: hypothetical protein EOP54_17760, partial [Sphingobacteriales bacterium]